LLNIFGQRHNNAQLPNQLEHFEQLNVHLLTQVDAFLPFIWCFDCSSYVMKCGSATLQLTKCYVLSDEGKQVLEETSHIGFPDALALLLKHNFGSAAKQVQEQALPQSNGKAVSLALALALALALFRKHPCVTLLLYSPPPPMQDAKIYWLSRVIAETQEMAGGLEVKPGKIVAGLEA
jgi:hypothetical protein